MGKGGPLAFLNKKTWHPRNARNQEEIWKREQQYLAELSKADELKKQIEEEREKEEWERIAEDAKKKKKTERLEWMYQGGFAAQEEANKRKEEMLLGKHAELPAAQEPKTGVEAVTAAPPSAVEDVLDNANETWARLNADPLLWMKREEQAKVKSIVSNPYHMMQMKEQIRQAKREKKEKKKEKKSKEHKKSKSKDKSRSPSPSPPPSKRAKTSDDARERSPPRNGRHRAMDFDDDAVPRRNSGHDADRRADGGASNGGRDRVRDGPVRTHDSAHRDRDGRDSGRRRDGDRGRENDDRRDRHHSRAPLDSMDARRGGADDRNGRGDPPRRKTQHDGDGAPRQRSDQDGASDRRRVDRDDAPIQQRTNDRSNGAESVQGGRDSRGGAQRGYGLQVDHIPAELRSELNSQAAATRERLAEAAKAKALAEEEAKRARHAKKDYRPGKMDEEEIARRRAEMEQNAKELEQHRTTRLVASYADKKDAGVVRAGGAEEFVAKAQQDIIFNSNAVTLQEQVRRKKGTLQR